ncbi:hypothetical protein PTKIN_Ptkin14bG0087700 [Pterospermum kingtungense]
MYLDLFVYIAKLGAPKIDDSNERGKEGEKRNPMGGKRTSRRMISIRELEAQMAEICEEQKNLREGQREVQQKFEQVESQISLMQEQGKSLGRPASFSGKQYK